MIDFGSDVSTFPDLDPTFAELTGPRVVLEAVARRLSTPQGALDYDPDYGLDVRRLLSAALDTGRMFFVEAQLRAEAEKDERVFAATVRLDVNAEAESMVASIGLETASGPFRLTLAIDKVSARVLSLK